MANEVLRRDPIANQQTSPFGVKPSDLAAPIPGEDEGQALAEDISQGVGQSIQIGEEAMSDEQQLSPEDELLALTTPEDELMSLEGEAESFPSPEEIAEDPTFAEANLTVSGLKQQVDDLRLRALKNFAETPSRQEASLKGVLGDENVKPIRGGVDGFLVRRPGEKKFRRLDPETLDIIGDVAGDFGREVIETGFGIVGAAKTPKAPSAGFGAGVFAGANFADVVGEALGVKRPGEQLGPAGFPTERVKEAAIKGATAAAFDKTLRHLGGKFSKWMSNRAKMAKLKSIPPAEILADDVVNNMQLLRGLEESGIIQKIPGTDVSIMAHQMLPHIPNVKNQAAILAGNKSFQNTQRVAEQGVIRATNSIIEAAAQIEKGSLANVLRTGERASRKDLAKNITNLFHKVRKEEGKIIETFRNKASKVGRTSPLPAERTAESLKGIFKTLGVKPGADGKPIFPDEASMAQILGTDSKAFIKGFKQDMTRLFDKLDPNARGGLSVDELVQFSQVIGAKNQGASRVGGQYKAMIGKLSSSLRADSREALGTPGVLSADDAASYVASMDKFGKIASSMDQLGNYLNSDLGANTFVRGLVSKGRQGLPNLKATKEFLLQENPELWKKVSGEYMEELFLKHRLAGKEFNVNSKGILKELNSLGPEYLKELFPKGAHKNVIQSLNLSNQVKEAAIKGTEEELKAISKKAIHSLSLWHRGVNAVAGVLHLAKNDSRLLKLISREGVEEFLEQVPKSQQGAMRRSLQSAIELGKINGKVAAKGVREMAPQQAGEIGADVLTDRQNPATAQGPGQ